MENVCGTCGDEGFVEAIIYCDSCKLSAVHRYCCGITPVPLDGYVTWFCSDCDESDTASDSIELQDTSNVEVSSSSPVLQIMEEPETRELTGLRGIEAAVSEAGEGASVLQMSERKKKKKKKRKIVTHSLPDDTIVETMEVSEKQYGSESGKSDELIGVARNEISVLEKSGKKKKKTDNGEEKKNGESSNQTSRVLEAEGHELQATPSVEPMKESKKRKCSGSRESEELNVLVGNEALVLDENEKQAKKKKKNKESSTHTLPVLDAEDHVLQDVTSVEAMKESTVPKSVVLEKSAKKKKKKKRNEESNNHTSPVLKAVDCGHQDTTTSVEAMKESKKQKTSDSRESGELNGLVRNEVSVLENCEKKKKKEKKNEESTNHTAPVLAAKNHLAYDTDNVEPAKAQESSASRKPHELAGLEKTEASFSEGGNSTNMPDHSSSTTSKKRSLSFHKTQVTSEIMELPASNSPCKEAESIMHHTNDVLPALDNVRAQPISGAIWRGSITVKQGNVCNIHGLVAHLSTLARPIVHEKAGSLRTRLSAEMFPRLDIWPPSFLKGPPTDDNIALYFFPSRDSNAVMVYYSLVDEMKKKDLAMRCLFDDAELLIFTSQQLPLHSWKFKSKEYLWGIFRRRKTSRP